MVSLLADTGPVFRHLPQLFRIFFVCCKTSQIFFFAFSKKCVGGCYTALTLWRLHCESIRIVVLTRSLRRVSVESQSIANPLRMKTRRRLYGDCTANWCDVESPKCESGISKKQPKIKDLFRKNCNLIEDVYAGLVAVATILQCSLNSPIPYHHHL